jgi:hypothetical protein
MGLLDDAIREHLELKRRRGADPAEVEKQEREALGPIGAAPPAEAAAPLDHVDDEPLEDAVSYDDGRVPLDDERDALLEHDDHPVYDTPDDRWEPEPEPAPAPVSQPTEQYAVEDLEELRHANDEPEAEAAPRADAPAEGEDVLDETPEFLQEAPEHDRLWFEQRPPRDFDF